MAEQLISRARIGCVPGADFGPHGEGYIRFCFARDRRELSGALESMGRVFGQRRRQWARRRGVARLSVRGFT